MKARLVASGTRPLLMHNVQLASPLNAYAKRLKALNSKRVKTDEDRLEIARVEWEGSLYYEPEIGPCMPGANLFSCLIMGARLTKAGMKVERGVSITTFQMPLIYQGPRTIPELWATGESEYIDIRSVVVQRSKVDRCRPIFRQWAIEAEVLLDTAVIEPAEFSEIARNAGAMAGLGDYRRMFGRFDAVVDEL